MIFHSHANKTHFHKNGCALGLSLKVRVFGTWKWPIAVDTTVDYINITGTLFPPLLNQNGSFCYRMLWDVPFCIHTIHKDGWNPHHQISVSIFKTFVQRVQICWLL